MKTHRVLLFSTILFIAVFLTKLLMYDSLMPQPSWDTPSYQYLVTPKDTNYEFFRLSRTPAFPLYLYSLALFNDESDAIYKSFNIALSSAAIVLLFFTMHKLTGNLTMSTATSIVAFFDYQVSKFDLAILPEAFVTFFVMLLIASVVRQYSNRTTQIPLILTSLLMLLFTKPIFAYLAILVFILVLYWPHKNKSPTFPRPVILWLLGAGVALSMLVYGAYNWKRFGFFAVSSVPTINMAEKVIQYNMVKKTTPDILSESIHNALTAGTYPHIYERVGALLEQSQNMGTTFTQLQRYVISIMLHNPMEYATKSIQELPKVFMDAPLSYDKEEEYVVGLTQLPRYHWYRRVHDTTIQLVIQGSFLLLIESTIFVIVGILTERKHWFIATFFGCIIWIHGGIIATSAYVSYSRLRAPIDYLIILFIVYSNWLFIKLRRARIK